MTKSKKTEKVEKAEKKKYSAFSFFSGLILLIIALGLVLVRNGVNLFGKGDTPEEVFVKANTAACDKFNEELLEYLMYCGKNARENNGKLSSETIIGTEKEQQGSDIAFVSSIFEALGMRFNLGEEEYVLKNTDGEISLVRDSDKQTLYSRETLLAGLDFSRLGKKSALKEKNLKKLLTKYEEMFFDELLKDGFEYQKDELTNIDEVYLVGNRYTVDYSQEDIRKALEVVLEDISTNKKCKTAYETMGGCDFTGFMSLVEERLLGEDSLLACFNSLKAAIWVRTSGNINAIELTFDIDDKAIEEKLMAATSGLFAEPLDIDPVFTLSMAYTLQGDARGFRFSIVNAEGAVRMSIEGHGNVTTTGLIKSEISGFSGTARVNFNGKTGTLTLKDAMYVDVDKGFRYCGNLTIAFEDYCIMLEAKSTNKSQEYYYWVLNNDKAGISGSVIITD